MKLLFVFGTRPEAIKLAPVIRELTARPEFECRICATGQHREILTQFLRLFELCPDWDLDVMRADQDLAYLTGAVLSGVSRVLDGWRGWLFHLAEAGYVRRKYLRLWALARTPESKEGP